VHVGDPWRRHQFISTRERERADLPRLRVASRAINSGSGHKKHLDSVGITAMTSVPAKGAAPEHSILAGTLKMERPSSSIPKTPCVKCKSTGCRYVVQHRPFLSTSTCFNAETCCTCAMPVPRDKPGSSFFPLFQPFKSQTACIQHLQQYITAVIPQAPAIPAMRTTQVMLCGSGLTPAAKEEQPLQQRHPAPLLLHCPQQQQQTRFPACLFPPSAKAYLHLSPAPLKHWSFFWVIFTTSTRQLWLQARWKKAAMRLARCGQRRVLVAPSTKVSVCRKNHDAPRSLSAADWIFSYQVHASVAAASSVRFAASAP